MYRSAGNDGSSLLTASSQEALPWGPPQRPKTPRGIGMVATVDLAIMDLTAFRIEFICRDGDEPIPPGQGTNLQLLQARMHDILYL